MSLKKFSELFGDLDSINSTNNKIEVLTPDLWGGPNYFDETNNLLTERLKMI